MFKLFAVINTELKKPVAPYQVIYAALAVVVLFAFYFSIMFLTSLSLIWVRIENIESGTLAQSIIKSLFSGIVDFMLIGLSFVLWKWGKKLKKEAVGDV